MCFSVAGASQQPLYISFRSANFLTSGLDSFLYLVDSEKSELHIVLGSHSCPAQRCSFRTNHDSMYLLTESSARICMSQGNMLKTVKKGYPSADVLR